jgi:proteic killer suppression protein
MIKSFRHKGLERFYRTDSKSGIQAHHVRRLRNILGLLDMARVPKDMDAPGYRLHPLTGDMKGFWSVWVDQNWRVVFGFDGGDVILVDYCDYH